MQPFRDLRVMDMTQYIAGPHCSQFLGTLGAEVIKLEPPGGDPYRRFEGVFHAHNLGGKKSVGVDLTTERGQAVARDLLASADVFVESYRPGTLEKFGLDYESVAEYNESIVYCSVSGFGQTGPYAERPATNGVAQAASALSAYYGRAPEINLFRDRDDQQGVGFGMVDVTTGVHAFGLVASALYERAMTGEGTHVDVSLYDVAFSYMANRIVRHDLQGSIPTRDDDPDEFDFGGLAPYGVFEVGDGEEVFIAGITQGQFEGVCRAIDRPDLVADERFETREDRVANADSLREALEAEFAAYEREALWERLAEEGVPTGPFYGVAEVLEDPHVRERDMVATAEHAETGEETRTARLPVRTRAGAPEYGGRLPAFGEHTAAVLRDLGYDGTEVARLADDEVVFTAGE